MRRMTTAAIVAACSLGVWIANASGGDQKVLLCHATDSAENPYELILVAEQGYDGHMNAGHGDGVLYYDHLAPDGATSDSDCLDSL